MPKRAYGLDSSAHDIFFEPAQADIKVDFCILRTGYALMRDKIFLDSAKNCLDANKLWMVYHYLSTGVPWRDQVEFMLNIVSQVPGKPSAYWIDFETAYNQMSISFANQCCQAMELLSSKVVKRVGLYTNNDLYDHFIARSGDWHLDYPLWISWPITDYHNDRQPLIPELRHGKGWDFWQFNSKGNGQKHGLGRFHAADLDVFNGTKKDLEKWLDPSTADCPSTVDVEASSTQDIKVKSVDTTWIQEDGKVKILNIVSYEK